MIETPNDESGPPACSVPVLLLAHARPDLTARVIARVREANPPRVYLAVDGPRSSVRGEGARVDAVRELLTESVDWSCEVKTLFRKENLGIREGIAESITWFFENEEMGIILEDDCLPDPSFFPFCEDLLGRYRDDHRVMHVGGSHLFDASFRGESYFFSRYPLIWGWAGWASRWEKMSLDPDRFEDFYGELDSFFLDPDELAYWKKVLRAVLDGRIASWDYFWAMTVWKNGGLSASSLVPLIRNIGFEGIAENTKWWKDYRGLGERRLEGLEVVNHPSTVKWDQDLDRELFEGAYRRPPLVARVWSAGRLALRHLKRNLATGRRE